MMTGTSDYQMFTSSASYEEGPLRERKQELPNLLHDERKAEFLKDVLALANTARLRGKPAYLLFGMDDDGHLCGLGSSLDPYLDRAERIAVCHADWDESRRDEELWCKVIGRAFLDSIERHIDTQLAATCELHHGLVEGCLCAYLLIPPIPTPKPFEISHSLESGRNTLLRKEQSWIRIGESKREINVRPIDAAPHDFPFTQVPYPFPTEWRECFRRIRAARDLSEIPGYQDLYSLEGTEVAEIIADFMRQEGTNLLIVRGKAGIGKSVLLRRLISQLADEAVHEMEQIVAAESFEPPSTLIPVYISLRGWRMPSGSSLDREVINCFNRTVRLWVQPPKEPERMLESPLYRWLLCLDGLDEIWSTRAQRSFVSALNSFQRRYPRVKMIVTTRPDVTLGGLQDHDVRLVDVAPLTPLQIESYLSAFAGGPQVQEILEFLQAEPDLWALCGIPAFLEAAARAWLDEYSPPQTEAHVETCGLVLEGTNEPQQIEVVSEEDTAVEDVTRLKLEEIVDATRRMYEQTEPHDAGEGADLQTPASEPEDLGEVTLPISLGRVLDRIYQRLWEREACRRIVNVPDHHVWFNGVAKLAAAMDGTRTAVTWQEARRHLAASEGLHTVLSCGILEQRPLDSYLHFATTLVQAYFAARFVLPCVETGGFPGTTLKIIRGGRRPFWEGVTSIVRDLSYRDLTPLEQLVSALPCPLNYDEHLRKES